MSTPKLFTGGLDSGEEARKVPDITGEGAAEGVKARFVGDDSNRYEDRILSVPNSESSLGKIDLSLGADGFDDSPETSVEGDRDGNKIRARKARIKWTSGLLDRIKEVRKETIDVGDRVERLSRRLKRFK